jgi:hypothetical protein
MSVGMRVYNDFLGLGTVQYINDNWIGVLWDNTGEVVSTGEHNLELVN